MRLCYAMIKMQNYGIKPSQIAILQTNIENFKSLKHMRILFAFLYFLQLPVFAQNLTKLEINEIEKSEIKGSLLTFREFLKMPNDGNYPQQIEYNLKWCEKTFQSLGFKTTEIISSKIPHLYAEYITDPKKPNVLFYLQIDGQPVDKSAWSQSSPFEPVIKNQKGAEICLDCISASNFVYFWIYYFN